MHACALLIAVFHTGDAAEGMPYARGAVPAGMPEFAYPPALPDNRVVSQTLAPLKNLAAPVRPCQLPCSCSGCSRCCFNYHFLTDIFNLFC